MIKQMNPSAILNLITTFSEVHFFIQLGSHHSQ